MSDAIQSKIDNHVDFIQICDEIGNGKPQCSLKQCIEKYATSLLNSSNIEIPYFLRNCNNEYTLELLVNELLKRPPQGTILLKKIATILVDEICKDPRILAPDYGKSNFIDYNYKTPLTIFTTHSYYDCISDIFLPIRKVYDIDHSLFFSLLEKIKSKFIIYEFILRPIIHSPEGDQLLLEMIQNAPESVDFDHDAWNKKISIFILFFASLEKMKSILIKNSNDSGIKPLVQKLCDALFKRNDKLLVVCSLSAYLIRFCYFDNTEIEMERMACNRIATLFLEHFGNRINSFISINKISNYINGCDIDTDTDTDIKATLTNFKETGKLSRYTEVFSGFYSLLVFIALNLEQEMNDATILYFEYLLTRVDNFYYELPKNSGDLSIYHFYIASAYAQFQDPVTRWFGTHKLLQQLICRWHFNLFRKSSNSELSVITFFLHVGIALSDILSAQKTIFSNDSCRKICNCIWDDYKNMIISIGDPYWYDLHITVVYLFVFMCRIIDFESDEDLNWLYSKLSDFHSFPGLQLLILSNLNHNGFQPNHKLFKHEKIKREFFNAISSLEEYSNLLLLDKRENRYEYTDRDLNVYNAYIKNKNS